MRQRSVDDNHLKVSNVISSCFFFLPLDVHVWCSGHLEAKTVCNIAVVNAVWALMELAESQKNKDSDDG